MKKMPEMGLLQVNLQRARTLSTYPIAIGTGQNVLMDSVLPC